LNGISRDGDVKTCGCWQSGLGYRAAIQAFRINKTLDDRQIFVKDLLFTTPGLCTRRMEGPIVLYLYLWFCQSAPSRALASAEEAKDIALEVRDVSRL
jgi:hypothetical protein